MSPRERSLMGSHRPMFGHHPMHEAWGFFGVTLLANRVTEPTGK